MTTADHTVSIFDAAALPSLAWPHAADDGILDGYVYQSHEFLTAWFATMGEARRARGFLVVVEGRDGTPVLRMPLVVEREFGCSMLRFPDGGMADYNAPLLARGVSDDTLAMDAIWSAILRGLPPVDVVDFVKMPATVWHRPNPMLRIGPAVPQDEGYYLPITGTHVAYLADPSRKGRARKLGQLFRKLQRSGDVRLGEVRDPVAVAGARAFIEHHKALQYRRTLGFDQFDKPGVRGFLDRLCAADALASFTRMTVLTVDGEVIGAQLDFVTPRRQQGFMTTFDADRHGFVSPGRQVQMHLIERAFADGLEVFDLGHGDNPYKHPWMTAVLQLHSLAQARTARGRLFLRARAMRRRLPPGLGAQVRRLLRPRLSDAGETTRGEDT